MQGLLLLAGVLMMVAGAIGMPLNRKHNLGMTAVFAVVILIGVLIAFAGAIYSEAVQ